MLLHAVFSLAVLASTATNINGTVTNNDGRPIEGAIVVILSAQPRSGPSMLCPSCYPDCAKRAITKTDGTYSIENVSDSLKFQLACGAAEHQGYVSSMADPAEEASFDFELSPLPTREAAGRIEGTVLGDDNQPLAGCTVSTNTITKGPITTSAVSKEQVTPLTMTDQNGHFEIAYGKGYDAVEFIFQAPGYCFRNISHLIKDGSKCDVQLQRGAAVTGRLVFDGKPLSNVMIGMAQVQRHMGSQFEPVSLSTDAEGRFKFECQPPNLYYYLYTHANQSIPAALATSAIEMPATGMLADLGDLETEVARSLKIRIQTDDGSTLGDKSGLFLGRDGAWDGHQFVLPDQSTAEITVPGVAVEDYRISFRIPGRRVIKTTPMSNRDMNGGHSIHIREDGETEVSVIVGK
jgi:hypothetical protein